MTRFPTTTRDYRRIAYAASSCLAIVGATVAVPAFADDDPALSADTQFVTVATTSGSAPAGMTYHLLDRDGKELAMGVPDARGNARLPFEPGPDKNQKFSLQVKENGRVSFGLGKCTGNGTLPSDVNYTFDQQSKPKPLITLPTAADIEKLVTPATVPVAKLADAIKGGTLDSVPMVVAAAQRGHVDPNITNMDGVAKALGGIENAAALMHMVSGVGTPGEKMEGPADVMDFARGIGVNVTDPRIDYLPQAFMPQGTVSSEGIEPEAYELTKEFENYRTAAAGDTKWNTVAGEGGAGGAAGGLGGIGNAIGGALGGIGGGAGEALGGALGGVAGGPLSALPIEPILNAVTELGGKAIEAFPETIGKVGEIRREKIVADATVKSNRIIRNGNVATQGIVSGEEVGVNALNNGTGLAHHGLDWSELMAQQGFDDLSTAGMITFGDVRQSIKNLKYINRNLAESIHRFVDKDYGIGFDMGPGQGFAVSAQRGDNISCVTDVRPLGNEESEENKKAQATLTVSSLSAKPKKTSEATSTSAAAPAPAPAPAPAGAVAPAPVTVAGPTVDTGGHVVQTGLIAKIARFFSNLVS